MLKSLDEKKLEIWMRLKEASTIHHMGFNSYERFPDKKKE